ncbi:hypothetical protein A9C19_16195 [Bacillus weihaiensis]|uniref:Uncharacterized protein n=1 Tax=Bacillus weihaiensis TaxID=1547283 RepID=A0A1L3MUZ8_9BACI|nr:hypothetical protein A9C19_16195 [Bacillus weihaiensis]
MKLMRNPNDQVIFNENLPYRSGFILCHDMYYLCIRLLIANVMEQKHLPPAGGRGKVRRLKLPP